MDSAGYLGLSLVFYVCRAYLAAGLLFAGLGRMKTFVILHVQERRIHPTSHSRMPSQGLGCALFQAVDVLLQWNAY